MSKAKKLSLHIVENHDEILFFILRAIGSKCIPFDNNLLIHFDAHPDLLLNTNLKSKDVFDKYILSKKVSIETWILPIFQAGHFSTIVWVKPDWANQIDDGFYSFYIGEDINGNIKVSSPFLYFISALNFSSKEDLINPKLINLHVITFNEINENICLGKLEKIIKDHNFNYLLDIDLDFFCTENPFLKLYPLSKTYEILNVIYKFTENDILKAKSPKEAQIKRSKQIHSLESIFKSLDEIKNDSSKVLTYLNESLSDSLNDEVMFETLRNLVKDLIENYKFGEIDWLMIHDAGTTVDDPNRPLPHHNDISVARILVKSFCSLVQNLPQPKLISIARSTIDEYTPSECVEFLQETVCDALKKKFIQLDIKCHYLNEDNGEAIFGAAGMEAANASIL